MAAFSAQDLRDLDASQPARANPHAARLAALAQAIASEPKPSAVSRIVFAGLVRIGEFALVTAAGFLVYWLHLAPSRGYDAAYAVAISLVAVLVVLVHQALGLYTIDAFRKFKVDIARLVGGLTLVFLATLSVLFFLKLDETYSRLFILLWYGCGLGFLIIERALLARAVRYMIRTEALVRRTVIVGGGPAADQLIGQLASAPPADLHILGIFDDRTDERSPDIVAGFPKLGTVEDLVEFARDTRIDLVIFTLPITAEQRLLQMLRKLWILPVDIRLAAHMSKLRFRPRSYSYIGSVPVFDVFDKPLADWDVVVKTLFDKIVGSLCLILLAPLMAIVALAIKLDSKGPILFKQKRYGFNNELVEIYKFRSMRADNLDYDASKLVTKADPRVTRVGRFIRKTSLDELPQLFNVVFKGNLSLVGPRPHAANAKAAERQYDEVVDGYFARHRVRPGITGWAQIHGWRGETDTPEKIQNRVEHDLYYIENWSIFLDIRILLATPFALLNTENAY
ncbi:MAG: undecaprenyl-phosphate glucose phosphotransferase [Beijerinckiaceae bacterium]